MSKLSRTNVVAMALGLGSVVILLYFNNPLVKQLKRLGWSDQNILPISKSAPLLVIILGTLLVWAFQVDKIAEIKVVGEI